MNPRPLIVFANDFLLLSEKTNEFKHSTSAKFIGLPDEPVQTSLPKPVAEMKDYICIEPGKARFWVVFYLSFDVTLNLLHYFEAWPATHRVPIRFAPEIKAAKSAISSEMPR